VTIVQQPSQSNDFTLIVEFDDNPPSGPDWYEIDLTYLVISSTKDECKNVLPRVDRPFGGRAALELPRQPVICPE
jgi:hypothetical protein